MAAALELCKTGMSHDQAVEAMGQPDLKDNVPDPNQHRLAVLALHLAERG